MSELASPNPNASLIKKPDVTHGIAATPQAGSDKKRKQNDNSNNSETKSHLMRLQ